MILNQTTRENKELERLAARKKVYSLLGLALRAGKLASGEFMTEKSVKEGLAQLVITAGDASDNTKKNFRDMCTVYEVPFALFGTKDELGHAIGKDFRASMAVCDEGFARSIRKAMEEWDARSIQQAAEERNI